MRPTVSHYITTLTANVPISLGERGVWNKLMIQAANLKIKMTRKRLKLLLLQKLGRRGIGCNEVEEFARRKCGEEEAGAGDRWRREGSASSRQ